MDTMERMAKFEQLPLKEKKKMLQEMIYYSKLEEVDPIFLTVFALLDVEDHVDDRFCNNIYQEIINYADSAKTYIKNIKQQGLKNIQQHIASLKKQEEKEKHQDNPDALLEKL